MKRKNWTEAETTYLMENYPAIIGHGYGRTARRIPQDIIEQGS